jgi:hypothetical protein
VPVFRKKSEKYSIVSIKALITHRSEEENSTKIFLKLYLKSWALSMDTTSCAHEVNLLCFDFLWKSLSPVHITLVLCLLMQSQCVRRLVHNLCGKNVENVFESYLQRASLRD